MYILNRKNSLYFFLSYSFKTDIIIFQSFHNTSTFIGYGTFMCFVGFISLLLPETYNQPLPDIVKSRHRIIASQDLTRIAHDWNKM